MNENPTYKVCVWCNTYNQASYIKDTMDGFCMQLRDIAPSLAVATVTALSVYFLKFLPLSYWIVLPMQVLVGAFTFLAVCKVTKINEYSEILNILKRRKNK